MGKEPITINLPEKLKEQLQQEAERRGISFNAIVMNIRIPYEMNTELILIAEEYGISKNALILKILRNWVKEKGLK